MSTLAPQRPDARNGRAKSHADAASKSRNIPREILFPQAIRVALEKRRDATGVTPTEQVRRALVAACDFAEQNGALPWATALEVPDFRFSFLVDEALWARVTEAARRSGRKLRDFATIAVLRYLETESQTSAPKQKLRDILREELSEIKDLVRPGSEFYGPRGQVEQLRPLDAPAPVRDALQFARPVKLTRAPNEGPLVTVHQLPAAPCGNWREVWGEGEPLALPASIAALFGAQDGDLIVPCDGQSMERAGVPDGASVVIRPIPDGRFPKLGEIGLFCVTREDGEVYSTLKFWYGKKHGLPDLRDGALMPIHIPRDLQKFECVGVLVGIAGAVMSGAVKERRALSESHR